MLFLYVLCELFDCGNSMLCLTFSHWHITLCLLTSEITCSCIGKSTKIVAHVRSFQLADEWGFSFLSCGLSLRHPFSLVLRPSPASVLVVSEIILNHKR
jgi:hypothetical protein